MNRTLVLYIFLNLLLISAGFGQTISSDSLFNYYSSQLQNVTLNDISKQELSTRIDNYNVLQITTFSEFQEPLELIAIAEITKQYELGIELISKLIVKTNSINQFQGFLYYELAGFYLENKKAIAALEYYLKASVFLEKGNEHSSLAHTYFNIGRINLSGWNNEIGIKYATKGLVASRKIKKLNRLDSLSLLGLYEIHGIANRRMRRFEEAIVYIDKAVNLATVLGDSIRIALNNGNKATVYYETGQYKEAIPLLQKDFETSIRSGIYFSGMNALIYLSWIYIDTGDLISLQETFEKMKEIDEKYPIANPKSKVEYLLIGAKVSEINGDTARANQYLRTYVEQDKKRDSINLSNDVSSLHERHLMEQEIKKLELLQSTNQLQASHLKMRTALLIIIALALLFVLWYVFMLRNKNKKIDKLNEMLEAKVSERTSRLMEINKELDTYLYRASHDIRRPIRTLLGLNNIAQINTDPEQVKDLFCKVHETAISMDKMLFKLQMAYELNKSHTLEEVKIEELISESIEDMSLEIAKHSANIDVKISTTVTTIQANKTLLKIALDNILENALVYQNYENNEIDIFTDLGNHYFYIHVRDTGYGIPEKYWADIFKPYFKISNKTQGSGLGLFLAQKALSFLDGEIAVSSKVNEGSQFTMKIPLNPK